MKYLIQQSCPDFVAPALMSGGKDNNVFRLSNYLGGSYGVIFFFPLDFNTISWTELLGLQKRIGQFKSLNAKIVAISGDSPLAHRVWQSLPLNRDGVGALDFPLVSDMTHEIAKQFDVLVAGAMPEAATIIADREGKVVFQLRHDTAIGRNIDRILEAIAAFDAGSATAPTSPVEQILLVEQNAMRLQRLGFNIVAQSVDTPLDHPQWRLLPRDASGKIALSFPFLDCKHEWPKHQGLTIAVREGLNFHSTGLLMPDGQLLFEHHSDRQVPRDFSEMLRIADAVQHHFKTGETVPWDLPGPLAA